MSLYYENPICVACKTEFERNPIYSKQKMYCSSVCRGESRKKPLVKKPCKLCKEIIEKLPYQARKRTFCSKACYYKNRAANTEFKSQVCSNCGDTYVFRLAQNHNDKQKFCTPACKMQVAMKEEDEE